MAKFNPDKRTIAYVDGFNLYHLALRDTSYRWIDPKLLMENVVGHPGQFDELKFYTANVSSKIDADAPKKQQIYLSALQTVAGISIHKGNFVVRDKWRKLSQEVPNLLKPSPILVKVVNPEEKGSDVNLGVHLVRDAFTGAFEQAVVCTNDTDLFEPIRIVVHEVGLPVILVTPNNAINRKVPTAKKLKSAVNSHEAVYHMREQHLRSSALPTEIIRSDGKTLHKPESWNNSANRKNSEVPG